jgi:hypothetical protein
MIELDLAEEVAAYIRERPDLVARKSPPWVLFAEGMFQQAFADYPSAVGYALARGLAGRFLVRNLYAEPAEVPLVFVREA